MNGEQRKCIRPGCGRLGDSRSSGKGRRLYCSSRCRKWHRSFTAFTEGGVAMGRDANTDAVLFAGIRALGLFDPRTGPVLCELFEAYGRRG